MATKKVQNAELLNSMRKEMSTEYQNRIPVATDANGKEIYAILQDYPTAKNEFLDMLTNKVIKSTFYSKVFENPLKMFHRGELPFGQSLEQLFVGMANKHGFRNYFNPSAPTPEADLIRELKPIVDVNYISKNFEYKYKVSISEEQLRTAFYNQAGLSELVGQLLNSMTSGAYYDEFMDMKVLLEDAVLAQKKILGPSGLPTTVSLGHRDVVQTIKFEEVEGFNSTPSVLSEKVRGLAGRLTFPSTKYNMAGVNQWSRPEDLVFITTPEIQAKLDVNVLAEAFNVSKAELNTRTVLVDVLPCDLKETLDATETTTFEPYGMVVDRDFMQYYDTLHAMRRFDNGANLTVNNFLHKQGIMANCYFANAVMLGKRI